MAKQNILTEMQQIIANEASYVASVNFINIVSKSRLNILNDVDSFTETEQITLMNNFWRGALCLVPNTLEIRVWLCDGDDITAYLTSFKHNWLALVLATGILNVGVK